MVTSSIARSRDTESWGTTNMSIQPRQYCRSFMKVPCGIMTWGRSSPPNRRGGGSYTPITSYGTPLILMRRAIGSRWRSEEHTSELQSHHDLVCRLLLEKKK